MLANDPVVEIHDLTCLLDELRFRRKIHNNSSFKLGRTSQMLAKMKVNETKEVDPIARSKLSSAKRTARKILNNGQAQWRGERQPNGKMLITRRPDGTSPNEPRTNPAVLELSSMRVGEFKDIRLITKGAKGYIPNAMKVRARVLMNDLTANWKTVRLANGSIRCNRVM